MKNSFIIFALIILCSFSLFAQDASSYFPSQPGYKWNYLVIPRDSVNNELDSLSVYEVDSFAVVQNYDGKSANVILSKTGPAESLAFLPYSDTSYTSFEGSDGYEYFSLFNIDLNFKVVKSNSVNQVKLRKVSHINGWQSFYRFAAAVNTPYQISLTDTTISLDSATTLPIQFEFSGTRKDDENINSDGINYMCKKFAIDSKVSVVFAPLPPIPIFTVTDTVWIASGQWIVQDLMPSVQIDLTGYGLGVINFPGYRTVLISQLPTAVENESSKINDFKLYQNYPNPFNPSTNIKYSLANNTNVELTVYDLLGNKVTTLINKEQSAGNYVIDFNPSLINGGLSTGVYFYRLKTNSGIITKKLLYLK